MSTIGKSLFFALAIMALCRGPAFAHASEQGFILLLPTTAYAVAGTAAVIASFVLVTCLSPTWLGGLFRARDLGGARVWPMLPNITSLLATFCFWGLVLIGLYGPTDPQSNLLPLTIWTLWWVGMFVIQGLIADVWRWLNPWTGLHYLMARDTAPIFQIPTSFAAWPAVVVFLAFQCFVLADIAPNDPTRLSKVAISYWAVTFAGILAFGPKAWLSQVECFTVLFRLITSLRPVQITERIRIGFPGWNSVAMAPLDTSRAVFCLMILASGSFDGLHETFWWLGKIGINPLEFPGRSAVVVTSTLGLLAANALLIAVFALAVWIGLWAVRLNKNTNQIAFLQAFNTFAIAILPIAIGYHFAHYLISFLVQFQYAASTLGDPLAKGWNLFSLNAVRVTTGFLSTSTTVKAIWLTQAGAVVASHILAVMMTHHLAAKLAPKTKELIAIQAGLCVLMIFYTIFGLWLLGSPRGV